MKLRIEGDGTMSGTRVLDENDNMIERVHSVELKMRAEKPYLMACITITAPLVDLNTTTP